MTSKTFITGTVIDADWLNDVNTAVYKKTPVSPADFGAKRDGVTDDSNALEACMNSGADYIVYGAYTYKITRPINIYTSGVIHDLRGTTLVQASTNTSAIIVGYNNASFVKTDDNTFIGGTFQGADNGLTTTVSVGITVYPPSVVPYIEGAGCSRTRIINTKFDSFCISISATGADQLEVDGIYSTNTKYHSAVSAGGYGILAQTCFGVTIGPRNVFKGSSTCRHAVYISADPNRTKDSNNVCRKISISACRVDWDNVTGLTGFEAGIFIRGAFNIAITGTIITGSYGGIVYDLENAPGENITITGVQATGIRASGGENSGIQFTRSTGTYRAKNVTVTGCTVQLANSNTHGIQLGYIDGVTSGGHTIGRVGDSYISGIYTVNCSNITHNSSTVSGTWSSGVLDFALASDNVQISRHIISGSGLKYKFYVVPTNLRFNYPRFFVVTSNGAGVVTATSSDGEVLTTSVVSEANGFTVTFPPEISTATDNFNVLSLASQVANIYHRTATSTTVTFGVLGISAGALVPLPAATNSYSIQITLNR